MGATSIEWCDHAKPCYDKVWHRQKSERSELRRQNKTLQSTNTDVDFWPARNGVCCVGGGMIDQNSALSRRVSMGLFRVAANPETKWRDCDTNRRAGNGADTLFRRAMATKDKLAAGSTAWLNWEFFQTPTACHALIVGQLGDPVGSGTNMTIILDTQPKITSTYSRFVLVAIVTAN